MEKNIEDDDFSIYNINSIINFCKNNWFQLLLLLLVFIIIYVVDYISNINTIIFGLPSAIPGTPDLQKPVKPSKIGKKSKK
jgi:hypothetical protein